MTCYFLSLIVFKLNVLKCQKGKNQNNICFYSRHTTCFFGKIAYLIVSIILRIHSIAIMNNKNWMAKTRKLGIDVIFEITSPKTKYDGSIKKRPSIAKGSIFATSFDKSSL